MRIEGTLSKWNDDRGFGFIAPTQGGPDVFVHISAFPRDGRRPTVGERLTFELDIDREGKRRAKNLLCPTRPVSRAKLQPVSSRRNGMPGFLVSAILLAVVSGLAFYVYSGYSGLFAPPAIVAAPARERSASSSFRCDGRTYCSQMTSCAEAKYFLRHCPNVKMDGDYDGVPCEQQWCTNFFAR